MDMFRLEAVVSRRDVAEQLKDFLTDADVSVTIDRTSGRPNLILVQGRIVNYALFERVTQVLLFEHPSVVSFRLEGVR